MSLLKPLSGLSFLSLVMFLALPADAATSIWPPRMTTQSEYLLATYQWPACPQSPPAPYTGSLQLDSKYEQSDASRSTRRQVSATTEQVRSQINDYQQGLLTLLQQFERSTDARRTATVMVCLNDWLDRWARAGALLSDDSSSTGRAVRKWFLAAVSTGLLKVQAISNNEYQPSAVQQRWLIQLADQVMADYGPRQRLDYAWFNNHDYWAAWAVSATGMLLDQDAYLVWGDATLRLALQQAVDGQRRGTAYFPLEVGRGALAADYMHYALVPLVLLAETAEANNRPLTADEWQRLDQLASFAIQAVARPDNLPELVTRQAAVGAHKQIWLLPFLSLRPRHQEAVRYYQQTGDGLGYYGQLGGDLRLFYGEATR